MWSRFGVTDDERRDLSGRIIGRDLAGTTKNLTQPDAHQLLDTLHSVLDGLAPPGVDAVAADATNPVDARTRLNEWLTAHDPA
jgi:hypothetical protein